MRRTFTVELTEEEAVTLWRMAELSGFPAAQIVRHLHRTTLFQVAVSLATEEWIFHDDETGKDELNPVKQQQRFREFMGTVLDGCRHSRD